MLHPLSAWASRQRLVLGQEAAADESNEIAAIPLLLERLASAGPPVTIDAAGARTAVAETFARAVRAHRGIENDPHWTLDAVFRDDLTRPRTGHGPENTAVVRHMALTLLSRAKPTTSLKNRRKRAGWNADHLDRPTHPRDGVTNPPDCPAASHREQGRTTKKGGSRRSRQV